ncbi:hypothetical protein EV182_003893 [Spiromyces aspiralis]|uniref:Uncharacterized protein n=1 Tax=Spiromyces aspiralis TaxID=68401 RepID=A0ACC1HQG0_9FUNG|nr:hypothetical protein EV182_003893 [Spiromyces aspiralis]
MFSMLSRSSEKSPAPDTTNGSSTSNRQSSEKDRAPSVDLGEPTSIPVYTIQHSYDIIPIPEPNDAEKESLAKLRAAVPDLIKDLPAEPNDGRPHFDPEAWLTDDCLWRYLRARKGDLEKTKKALRKSLEWRRTYRPHAISPDDIEEESRTGKLYLNEFDRHGRPLLYMYNHRQNTNDPVQQIKWVVYTTEMAIRHMPPGVERVILMIDASQWSKSHNVAISTAREFLNIFGSHYPERLGKAIVFDPPSMFVWFFRLVSAFIDPVTKSKVAFVDSSARHDTKSHDGPWIDIDDIVPAPVREIGCGGRWNWVYNHSVYWPILKQEYRDFLDHKLPNTSGLVVPPQRNDESVVDTSSSS